MAKINLAQLKQHLMNEYPESFGEAIRIADTLKKYAVEADIIGDVPEQLWSEVNVKSLNVAMVPVEWGGSHETATAVRRTLIAEALGYADPVLGLSLPGPSLAMPPVLALGTQEQKEKFFAAFSDAEQPVWGAFATTELAVGSDATALALTATQRGDEFVINGQKSFIGSALRAKYIVVFANINPKRGRFGIRAFLLPQGTPNMVVTKRYDMLGMRALQLCELTFDQCVVPAQHMLGFDKGNIPSQDAFTGAQYAWDFMRPQLSSFMVGVSCAIVDRVKLHIESPQPGSSGFAASRAVSELIDMQRKVEAARLLSLNAAWRYDHELHMSKDASMAKLYSARIAMEIANQAMDIIGVEALHRDNMLEKFYRDIKAFDIMEGTGDMQSLMIARIHQTSRRNYGKLVQGVAKRTMKKQNPVSA